MARQHFAGIYRQFGLVEIESDRGRLYAEVVAANRARYLTIGIDQRQDYRVYARVGKSGSDGRPKPRIARPKVASDVVEVDVEFVVKHKGGPWEHLGAYGSGTREEVAAALDAIAESVELYAAGLLAGNATDWEGMAAALTK